MKKKVLGLISILVIVVLMFTVVKKEVTNSNATKLGATAEETMEITSQGLVITASGLIKDSTADADIKSNTEYLQGLINQVSTAGGGTVQIPANTYYFAPGGEGYNGAQYVIKCKNNVKIEGKYNSGTSYTILKPYGTTTNGLDMFYFNDFEEGKGAIYLENADFEYLHIDGEDAKAQTYKGYGRGFAINLYKNCDFESVTVENTEGTGFELDNPINSTISNCTAQYCGTIESEDYEEGSGIRIGTGYSDGEYIYINKSFARGNKKYGIFFKHKGLEDSSKYSATKTHDGFVVADSHAAGNAYDFGGEKAYDVTYINCYSANDTSLELSGSTMRFAKGSVRTSVLNCDGIKVFTDVVDDAGEDWYYPVYWAYHNGITSGYTRTEFAPEDSLIKQDAVSMIFRMARRPGDITFDEITTGFEDIDAESYTQFSSYGDAIRWAKDEGLVSAKVDFEPYSKLTINQYIYMLWLYDQGQVFDDSNWEEGVIPAEEFYEDAYNWAINKGIVLASEFADETAVFDECTRGYAVTMLYRYVQSQSEFSIKYNLQGGGLYGVTTGNPLSYQAGTDTFTLMNLTKEGYTFEGWIGKTYNNTGITITEMTSVPETTIEITSSDAGYKTYTAIWTPNTYTITFDANGGTGEMEQQYYTYDNPQALLENKFTKEGYIFDGWNTAKDGSGTSYKNGAVIENLGNLTLYAQWKDTNITYYISHYLENLDGTYPDEPDTTSNAIEGTLGGTALKPPSTPPGYSFLDEGDVTLTEDGQVVKYKFTRNTYNINFILGTGIEVDNKTQILPTKYGTPVTLQVRESFKDGYDSENLVWSGDYDTNTFEMPAKDVTITVKATPIKYSIEYKLYLGTIEGEGNPTEYTVEDTIILTDPTREGYEFAGWTDADGNIIENSTIPAGTTGNLVLTANWVVAKVTYKVEHWQEEAETSEYKLIETDTYVDNKIGDIVTPEVKTYYGFTAPEVNEVELTDDEQVIKYYYDRQSYNVSVFDRGGIKDIETKEYKYGQEVKLEIELENGWENPTWTDATIVNWLDNEQRTFIMPTKHVFLEIGATPIEYTITYSEDGIVEGNPTTYTVVSEDIILKAPEKDGYTFTGWTDADGNVIENATIKTGTTGHLELTANWVKNKYNVIVTKGNGIENVDGDGEYEVGAQVTLDATVKEGYDENSITWSGDSTFTMPAHNVEISVSATPTEYTITYNLGDGIASGNPETYTIESEAITLNAPTKEGYIFTGWTGFNGETPETQVTIPTGTTGDLTFTANWVIATTKFNVEVTKGKGIEEVTGDGEYEVGAQVTLDATVKEGYDENSITWSGDSTFVMPAEDVSITVSATPITYTITYSEDGKVEGNPTTYTVETEGFTLINPTKDGYEFIGWTGSNGTTPQTTVTIPNGNIGNLTYTANWEVAKVKYTIEYYKQLLDGTYSTIPDASDDTRTGSIGEEITVPVDILFDGFTAPQEQTIELSENSEDNVIKYYYIRNSYNITVTEGTGIDRVEKKEKYKYGETVELQLYYKTGYSNAIWSGNYNSNEFPMPAKDVVMEVNATPIQYTITYNLDGGNVEGNPTKYTVESEDFTLINPTRTGYTFIGWTGSNGSTPQKQVKIEKGTTGDLTYTANWKVAETETPKELNVGISYSTKELTNKDVTVIISANNKIEPVEGWTLSEDEKSISKIYEQNGSETVTIVDEYGNEKEQLVEVTNIDKIPPEVEITYEEKGDHVIVTAKTNEKVREVEGWKISEDKQELTKIYYVNKEEEFTFTDLAGNETKKTVKITSIVDPEDDGKDDAGDGNGENNNGAGTGDNGSGNNNKPGNTTTDKDSTGGDKTDTTVSNKDIPAAGLKYILGTGIMLIVLGVLSFAKMKKYKDIK